MAGVTISVSYGCNSKSAVTANGTYFSSEQAPSGGNCQLTYCAAQDVCQIRLDFENFVITGPYSDPLAGHYESSFKGRDGGGRNRVAKDINGWSPVHVL